jgi:hypothetical protein
LSWLLSGSVLSFLAMTLISRLRCLLVALALAVASLASAGHAYAGALHVRDPAHVLSAEDVARLRSVVGAAPFDARLVVTSEFSDAQDLSRFVHSLVVEPNMVVLGLDPQHRHVQVHFGSGSHVARSEWPAIERAGNDAFHSGDWEGGAAAIFQAASSAVSGANGGDEAVPEGARRSLLGPGTLLLIVLGAVGIGLYFAWRRSTSAVGPQGYGAPPPYGPGGYPPNYGNYPGNYPPGGLGPMGGGLIGAGLGGLAGYELGKLEGEREGREREREDVGGSSGDDEGGNYDEGGGGSSWDDGGGGFDGGGGDGGGSDF